MTNVPHFRVLYPSSLDKGILRTSAHAKVFVTFPGKEEIELTSVRSVNVNLGVNEADFVAIQLHGTYEVEYGD